MQMLQKVFNKTINISNAELANALHAGAEEGLVSWVGEIDPATGKAKYVEDMCYHAPLRLSVIAEPEDREHLLVWDHSTGGVGLPVRTRWFYSAVRQSHVVPT